MKSCGYCFRNDLANSTAVRKHQAQSNGCKMKRNAYLETLRLHGIAPAQEIPSQAPLVSDPEDIVMSPVFSGGSEPEDDIPSENLEGPEATRPHVTVEEIPDEDDAGYYEMKFPAEKQAGATFGESRTTFESIRDDQILRGAEVLGPFASDEEWELAKWLIKNVGHNQADVFLKLPIVSEAKLRMRIMTYIDSVDPKPCRTRFQKQRQAS